MTKLLQTLVSKGFLDQMGQTRGARYRLASALVSGHMKNISSHLVEADEWDKLLKIAEFTRANKRQSDGKIQSTLLQLCHRRWLTHRELADLLGRNSEGLRNRFLSKMVEKKLLRLRYPDKPNHSDQAYISNLDR